MDGRLVGLGVLLFIVFWGFQAGYLSVLGPATWFVGIIVFSLILWGVGKAMMPKPSPDHKMIWKFAVIFLIIIGFITSFALPFLGVSLPSNINPASLTNLAVAFWFIVFGGALFVGGWIGKNAIGMLLGIIWIFASVILTSGLAPANVGYIHVSMLAGIPFILIGLMKKK